ncbi:MAG: hypothetical protein INQ03_16675 [Candidatus Heimdallarchaeota archaeon]|nr:hypothetical protein [Candidatus Heimdallarchaeota archaeon]
MNPVMKFLWLFQSRRWILHENLRLQYPSIHFIGELGNIKDFDRLLPLLSNPSQLVRNASTKALRTLILRNKENPEAYRHMINEIIFVFKNASGLIEKLASLEVIKLLPIAKREEVLSNLVLEAENDLKYQVIDALSDTRDVEILNSVLKASNSTDLVLKRKALETWYTGLSVQELDEVLEYATTNLHVLIRATYELQLSGEFLNKILSYAEVKKLPRPKAYPDFIIRYLTELLGNWEYEPESYRSLHAIMVPSYFTFDTSDNEEENPFVVL